MKRFLLRLAALSGLMLAASLAVFLLVDAAPGDAAQAILGTSAAPDTLAALRAELGLDRPVLIRWLDWLCGILRGDAGRSWTYGVPVAELIGDRLLVTLPLTALATLIAVAMALPLGLLAAARPGGAVDLLAGFLAQIGIAVPNFWFGLILVLLVALGLGWFPPGGFPGWSGAGGGILAGLQALVLPAFALALPQAAVLIRVTRAAVLEVTGEDYIRSARARGFTRARVLWRHVLPNALIPVVTMLGLQVPFLISGAVLVENVFGLPGIGSLARQALAQRDLIVVQNVIMLFAVIVLIANALTDRLYATLDPRLRERA